MESTDNILALQTAAGRVPARQPRYALRFALPSGELFRIPRNGKHLHVLSGTAWISAGGMDVVASSGNCAKLVRTRHPALVSGLGGQPLLFEIW